MSHAGQTIDFTFLRSYCFLNIYHMQDTLNALHTLSHLSLTIIYDVGTIIPIFQMGTLQLREVITLRSHS